MHSLCIESSILSRCTHRSCFVDIPHSQDIAIPDQPILQQNGASQLHCPVKVWPPFPTKWGAKQLLVNQTSVTVCDNDCWLNIPLNPIKSISYKSSHSNSEISGLFHLWIIQNVARSTRCPWRMISRVITSRATTWKVRPCSAWVGSLLDSIWGTLLINLWLVVCLRFFKHESSTKH